jgi:hypothetical protein
VDCKPALPTLETTGMGVQLAAAGVTIRLAWFSTEKAAAFGILATNPAHPQFVLDVVESEMKTSRRGRFSKSLTSTTTSHYN